MKKLLFSTDFSANGTHAAEYGYNLAKQIKADVVLCNAVTVPAEIPQAGMIAWPMEEYDLLLKDSADELKDLESHLKENDYASGFKPTITTENEAGTVIDVINHIIVAQKIDLVVMGTHGSSALSQFLLGNHSKNMIDNTLKPLLLVPPTARILSIKKIAFATDFKQREDDLATIYDLIPMARQMNAEILITHVNDEKYLSPDFQKWIKQFLTDLSNKADYPHVYYRIIKNANTETGLGWLCEHGQIDMLAMVHRSHNFFDNLLKGSHTQKMARNIPVPLLVIPRKP
jgi:nucleotide-binding universal stress UspA family protein